MDPDSGSRWCGSHGSLVASRVVYGDLDDSGEALSRPGQCSCFDVMLASEGDRRINDERLTRALEAVIATAPDVRVFNFSFGDKRPLQDLAEVERREQLILTQDLDNLIFARDILVVIAAGNSTPGIVPSRGYPERR
ncbi:S8 family serine peptidase [Myxococcota bacterium]